MRRIFLGCLVLLGVIGVLNPAVAEPMMFISPLRVEIKPGEDVAVVTVTNKSSSLKYFKAVLTDQVMAPDTTTSEVETFPYSAKKMLRFMPRRFEIAPGQRRVIRIMARRPEGLADGDYHTHLLFEEDMEARKAQRAAAVASGTVPEGSVKFQVEATYSVAIPVVVQQGTISRSIALGTVRYDATAANGQPALVAEFARRGNAEASGYLTATVDGEPAIDKRLIRLYREVDDYRVVLPLNPKMIKPGAVVKVRLADSFSDAAQVYGQTDVTLP
jgi:hypothetical protein